MTAKSMNRLSLFSDTAVGSLNSANYAYRNKFSTIRNENDKIEFLRKLSRDYLKDFGIKKIVIAVYNEDGSHKSLFLRGDMVARDFLILALEKNFPQIKFHTNTENEVEMSKSMNRELCEMMFRWQIYEVLGDFHNYARPIYDHENIVEIFESWPEQNTSFRFLLKENPGKFLCVRNLKLPIEKVNESLSHDEELNWLLPSSINQEKPFTDSRGNLLKEIVKKRNYQTKGYLWIKKPAKPWKRKFCFISMGNLFYSKNAKSTDMSLIFDMENGFFYTGLDRESILNLCHSIKAPSPNMIIFRPNVSYTMDNENISAVCFKSDQEFKQWLTAFTILKFGWKQLCGDYTISNDMNSYRRLSEIPLNTNNMNVNMIETSQSERKKCFRRTPLPEEMRIQPEININNTNNHYQNNQLTKSQTSLFMTEANEIISRLDEINEDVESEVTPRNTATFNRKKGYEILENNPNTKIFEEGEDILFLYSESFPASTNNNTPGSETPKPIKTTRKKSDDATISDATFSTSLTNNNKQSISEKENQLNYKEIRNRIRNDLVPRLKMNEMPAKMITETNIQLKNCPYFYGLMSIDDTTDHLMQKGDFIIHDSIVDRNEKKTYLTGMLDDNSIAHIEINITSDVEKKPIFRLANKSEVFVNIYELISYYKANAHLLPIRMTLKREVIRRKQNSPSSDYSVLVDGQESLIKVLKHGEEVKNYPIRKFSDSTYGIDTTNERFPSVYKLAAYMEDNISTVL